MAVRSWHRPRPLKAFLPVVVWCVLACITPARAQQTHFVDVGLNGFAQFTDRDSGRSGFGSDQTPTFIRVGDTVQWVFHYQHSTTSGSCPNGFCQANGIWDSTILNGPPQVFSRSFSTVGTLSYFCLVHTSSMQGKIVVVEGPEFLLEVNNGQFFPQPGIPTITIAAGQSATFEGTISGFLGFNSAVNLSCQNGDPRIPSVCPGTTVFPNGTGTRIPFTFTVTDQTAGTYTFDLVATGTDPTNSQRQVTKSQRVQVNISDLQVRAPSPAVVSVATGFVSPSISVEVEAVGGFTGSVSFSCDGLPVGASCFIFPGFINFFPGLPDSQSVALAIDSGSAAPNIYPFKFVGSSVFNGSFFTRPQPMTLRLLPVDHFTVTAPATAAPNSPVNVTVKAVDHNEIPFANYQGTISFSSNDPEAILPANYTFTGIGNDNGVHNFPVTFKKVGPRTITVTDVSPFAVQATSGIVRVNTVNPNDAIVLVSSRADMAPPHFRDDAITFTAHVTASTGTTSPTGVVRFYEGLRELGTTTLVPSGAGAASATLTLQGLSMGTHNISAAYDGDETFAPNLSLEISQTRSPAPRCQPEHCP